MVAPVQMPGDAVRALDRSMAQAVAWNAAAKWITQILSWVSTIVVARLLTPSDYGLVGMAGLYLSLAMVVSQVGISDAVIALRDLSVRKIAELNTVALLIGAALFAVTCFVAKPLALFFSAPPLQMVVVIVSVTYLINAFQVVPRALLQKELRFQLLASVEVVRVFCQIVTIVTLAWLGFGYWSLVFGHILGTATSAACTLCFRRCEFAAPNFRQLGRELRFSSDVMISGVGWYAYSYADFLVAGRMLGQSPLGAYTLAWTISSAPLEKVGNLLIVVTPAFFSALQNDKPELRRYLSRLTEALSYVVVPASIGIALVADYFVPAVLGSKWTDAIGPLRLLGLLVAFRAISALPGKILTAIGDARFVMWTTVVSAVILPASFVIGSHWGTNGIAAAWLIVYPPLMLPTYYRTFRRIEMTVREYVLTVVPALNASVIMAVTILLVRWAVPATIPLLIRLLLVVLVGSAAYALTLFAFHRERLSFLFRTIRGLRTRKSDVAVAASAVHAE